MTSVRIVVACDELGSDPTAVDGLDGHRRGKPKEGEEPASKHHIQRRIGGLTRDWTTEPPIVRPTLRRREQEQEKLIFPDQPGLTAIPR